MSRFLLAVFNVAIVAALFIAALPIILAVLAFNGLKAVYDRLVLSAVYKGDKDKMDRDRYKDTI